MKQINTQLTNQLPGNPEPNTTESPLWAGFGTLVIGMAFLALVIPGLFPGLLFSVTGEQPKYFWYLSRATAIISYIFIWMSLVFGLLLSGRIAKYFPGAYTANDLHQFIGITGLVIGLFHGLLLMGDQYIHLSLVQVLLPFATQNYRPEWVGIGQMSFYIWVLVVLSSYIRKQIGNKTWRAIHFTGYLVFAGVMIHGITSGTDTGTVGMTGLYWFSGATVLFLTFYRIFAMTERKTPVTVVTQTVPVGENQIQV